jgi:6-phosphogluconolactonase
MDVSPAIRYSDLTQACSAQASRIAAALHAALGRIGRASLIVSGGKSPVELFTALRTEALDWSRVWVTLADERWVEPADAASNERLVREVLLKDAAAAAQFIGLKTGAPTPELGAGPAWDRLADWPRPFDFVLLGMGDDGHTASLFPKSPALRSALDEASPPGLIGMRAPTAPEARLSLNVSALLDSRHIVILIKGEAKWQTYTEACRPGPVEDMPVRALLRQSRTPVDVVWSP